MEYLNTYEEPVLPYEFGDEYDEDEAGEDEILSISDAFRCSCNKLRRIDIAYIAKRSGTWKERVVDELAGKAMFQNPLEFKYKPWNIDDGWMTRRAYLDGFVRQKLRIARFYNRRMPGRFTVNEDVLSRINDAFDIPFEEIDITLGSVFIPNDIYARFIQTELGLIECPVVEYNALRARYKVEISSESDLAAIKRNPFYSTRKMHALENIIKTMNAATLKVYDERYDYYTGKRVRILNKEETQLVIEIQKKLIRAFKKYITASTYRTKRVKEAYNKLFVGFNNCSFDGSYLTFPGLNPKIKLYEKQLNCVEHALMTDTNLLIAHKVGAGKTYIIIVIAHELYRTGKSKRNLIVVPNNILQDFEKSHLLLYPDDNILVVTPKMFVPKNRRKTLTMIQEGDYTAIYMPYSCFDRLKMSKAYKLNIMSEEIARINAEASSADTYTERSSLRKFGERKFKEMCKFREEYKDPDWQCFDELNIDTLFLDEAHNYKNIRINTNCDNIVGMNTKGSARSNNMLEKSNSVKRKIFSTGTPLTNSLSELFVLQTYLQPEQLKFRDIGSFDMWLNTFAEAETDMECDVTQNLRSVTRFTSFHNLTELMGMFSNVCDFCFDIEDAELPKFSGYTNVIVPKSKAQAKILKELVKRADAVRRRVVSRKDDNLLKITTDGRKCALDTRLLGIYDDTSCCKIKACAEKVFEVYNREEGKTQIVFSDIGTPKEGFNVYDELKYQLIILGIPAREIAFAHDAKNERQRRKLFKDVNSGAIRVVIGSTEKLGVGVNIQTKLCALHHLSVPWRPADIEQREGRILRRGNTCESVEIFRYITEGTFDSYSWQILQNKQKFISSFLSGTAEIRDMDDLSNAILSYAELKALAIGNKLIRERVEIANQLEHTRIASRQRQRQLTEFERAVKTLTKEIPRQKDLIKTILADIQMYSESRIKISSEERMAFGEELIYALKGNSYKESQNIFDEYQGFEVILPSGMNVEHPFIYLKSVNGGMYYLEMDYEKPLGCCRRIDILLSRLEERAQTQKAELSRMRKQLKDSKSELALGNTYPDKIDELERELEEIDKKIKEDEVV